MRFRSAHTQLRNRLAYMATRENSPSEHPSRIGPGKQALRQVGQVSRFRAGSRLPRRNPEIGSQLSRQQHRIEPSGEIPSRLGIGRQRMSTEPGWVGERIGKEEALCPLLRLADVQSDPSNGNFPDPDFEGTRDTSPGRALCGQGARTYPCKYWFLRVYTTSGSISIPEIRA
jgi:hypothetical protein